MRSGALLALATGVRADAVETRFITHNELRLEAKQNDALAQYLERNGYPDVAEIRQRLDSGEWNNETVILYYLDAHKEIAYGRAHMFTGDVGAQRLDRTLTDNEVAALSSQPSMRTEGDDRLNVLAPLPSTTSTDPADRAEAAALRAEQAADKVEEAAVRTERAAARAEAVVEKMMASSKR